MFVVELNLNYTGIMALGIGEKAPTFSLYNTEKSLVNLSDYEGSKNILLLFFPLAFTSVCTKELCSVRDNINKYHNNTTEVLGISVDSVYTLGKFKEEQKYNFPLLSDFNKEVSSIYDVIHESFSAMEMKGVSKRATFIVDRSGLLQYIEILENPGLMPDFDAINKKLSELA